MKLKNFGLLAPLPSFPHSAIHDKVHGLTQRNNMGRDPLGDRHKSISFSTVSRQVAREESCTILTNVANCEELCHVLAKRSFMSIRTTTMELTRQLIIYNILKIG